MKKREVEKMDEEQISLEIIGRIIKEYKKRRKADTNRFKGFLEIILRDMAIIPKDEWIKREDEWRKVQTLVAQINNRTHWMPSNGLPTEDVQKELERLRKQVGELGKLVFG